MWLDANASKLNMEMGMDASSSTWFGLGLIKIKSIIIKNSIIFVINILIFIIIKSINSKNSFICIMNSICAKKYYCCY
jgi:hypothetical protein